MIELCQRRECTGCGACANACAYGCISMKPDAEGFLFPCVDEARCRRCHMCEKVCERLMAAPLNARADHVLASWAFDQSIRNSSSSGGVFSVLAGATLRENGVVNGVMFDGQFNLCQRLIEKAEDLSRARGSRYVQSEPKDIYKRVEQELGRGRRVLFTSTPCQVAGLKAYLGKNYDGLTTCDFICHGVPSPAYFRRYLNEKIHAAGRSDIADYVFRDLKGWGWHCALRFSNGEEVVFPTYTDAYMVPFLAGVNYRESCYRCKYARKERCSDLTIGDFWGIENYLAQSKTSRGGVSLVVINTEKGGRLMREVRADISRRAYPWAACYDNEQLHRPSSRPALRDDFYAHAFHDDLDEILLKCGFVAGKRTLAEFVRVIERKVSQITKRLVAKIYVKVWECFER